jgi:hypothetical protein
MMENLEKLQTYRTLVKQLLEQYATYKPSHGDIEIQKNFDTERDHYQVVALGWDKKERIYLHNSFRRAIERSHSPKD